MGKFLDVLGTIFTPITSLIGTAADAISQKKQNQANMKLAQFQFDKNVEMWNLQNEYNKPLNQMTRLEEAGLNPNLVYGTGTVSGNTVGSAPQYEAPHITKYQKYQQAASAAVQMATAVQSIKNARAQENKTNKEAKVAENQASYLDSQKQYIDAKLRAQLNDNILFDMYGIQNAGYDSETRRYTAGLTLGRANAQEAENRLREPRFKQWLKESNARIARMSIQNKETLANLLLIPLRGQKLTAEIKYIGQQIKNGIMNGKGLQWDLLQKMQGAGGSTEVAQILNLFRAFAGYASGNTTNLMEGDIFNLDE